MNDQAKNRKGISLSTQILIGLMLGFFAGLFLGEKASALAIVGRAYIGLIQMSILPYMVVSLMLGIGSLSYEKAGKLAITGGIVLVTSWFLAFAIVFLMPLAFPSIKGGSFFSTSLVEVAKVDFIDLYIPVNPFSSMARTVVPAAAVFSVAFGIALIGVENKQSLLDILTATSKTLTRIAMMVVKVTPIGVFAIAANAAGTMTIEEFGRLQSYIIPFIVATLLLTFWILPGLAAALTPFSYREILKSARDALTTGFVTGNLFITLPMLVENARKLFEDRRIKSKDTDNYVEVLVPTSFNFPNIGKLLTLLFVLFAGWFVGKSIALTDYPGFAVLGLFTLFGGVDLALPFLLDQMQIPSDMYQLYVVTGVVNSWFATLLAVMNLFAFTLVAACAATGAVRINWSRIFSFAIISLVIFAAALLGTRFMLSEMVSKEDLQRRTLMHSEIKDLHKADIKETGSKEAIGPKNPLKSIIKRGKLRVGYNPENLPFSFINDKGDLVGFDVELMHVLARGLKVEIEFIEWTYKTVLKDLNQGKFDIAIGGLIVNPERLARVNFSNPYMNMTTALVVEDHRRNKFKSWRAIDKKLNARVGVVGERRAKNVKRYLPNTEIVLLETYSDFFTDNPKGVDALVISAEAGSAWTILYPAYSVVVPEPHLKANAAFAIPLATLDFEDFVNDWLQMNQTSGIIDKLYNKWILGTKVEQKKPRWSIGRDVFGLWE
ncbi:MAG: cation:dicarboxylase symporter family transporter [Desulfobacteraceae bacterium]|nr:cation:dicarboxylase symporter family transporter [Desulfobacteraceae bacterium]